MLISDMARKVPSAISAIRAIDGVRLGQRVPLMRGKLSGIRLVMRMPANRQVTNSGSLQAQFRQALVQQDPDDAADVDGEDGVEEFQSARCPLSPVPPRRHILDFRLAPG